MPALWGAAACLALSFGLAWLWRRLGWGDAPDGAHASRKQQQAAVPAVGGVAIAAGWCLQIWLGPGGSPWRLPAFERWPELNDSPVQAWIPWTALGLALAAGTLDDQRRRGLGPVAKLALQALCGAFLAWHDPSFARLALYAGLSIAYQNALNTFDNADGATSALCAAGLFVCASPLAPVLLVFLLPNLFLRRAPGGADPWAYLGDAGSALLGLALVLTPGAWPILVLPLLDFGWLSLRRLRLGLPPWRGDRRHLAHRLQRRGLGPLPVVLCLLALASPAILAPGPLGVGLCLLLYVLALALTRDQAEEPARPNP